MMRVALVGAGKIATEEHLPAWASVKDADLTWIVDRDGERARDVAARWGIPSWSTDLETVVQAGGVDAVDICSSAFTHVELVREALAAGWHVLVEKPLAPSVADASRLCDAARRAERVLMVAENWPYAFAFRRVQELLHSGDVGRLHSVSVVHRSGLRRGPVRPDHPVLGHTFIAGSHAVHLMRRVMGNVSQVAGYWHGPSARGAEGMVLDAAAEVVFQFQDGGIGNLHISSLAWDFGPRQLFLRLEGALGQIEFDVLSGRVSMTTAAGTRSEQPRQASLGFGEELGVFAHRVRDSGADPFVDIDYVQTLAVVEAIYRAFDHGNTEGVRPPTLG